MTRRNLEANQIVIRPNFFRVLGLNDFHVLKVLVLQKNILLYIIPRVGVIEKFFSVQPKKFMSDL